MKYFVCLFFAVLIVGCAKNPELPTAELLEVRIQMGGDYENYDSAVNITAPGTSIEDPNGNMQSVITLYDVSTNGEHVFKTVQPTNEITVQISLGELKIGIQDSNESTIRVNVSGASGSLGNNSYTIDSSNKRDVVTVTFKL